MQGKHWQDILGVDEQLVLQLTHAFAQKNGASKNPPSVYESAQYQKAYARLETPEERSALAALAGFKAASLGQGGGSRGQPGPFADGEISRLASVADHIRDDREVFGYFLHLIVYKEETWIIENSL